MKSNKVSNICNKLFEGKINKQKAVEELDKLGIKSSSAKNILESYRRMREGINIQRGLNNQLYDIFLNDIYKNYGKEALAKALKAVAEYKKFPQRPSKRHKLFEIYQMYSGLLAAEYELNDIEEREYENDIKEWGEDKLKEELTTTVENFNPQEKTSTVLVGIRNNKAIAIIKKLRGFACQVCGYSMEKKEGGNYIEAAHIIPKSAEGKETQENIILLCPNHHKEFDFGSLKIEFVKNERKFKITFPDKKEIVINLDESYNLCSESCQTCQQESNSN